jgi:type IV pilus assembly protein PilB
VTAPAEIVPDAATAKGYRPEEGRRLLGDVLLEQGIITEKALHKVLADQRRAREHPDRADGTRARLGAMLVSRRLATEEQVAVGLGEVLGREVVDPTHVPIDPEFARRLPRALAERNQVLLVGDGPGGLRVIAADPTDVMALDDVRRYTGTQKLDVLIATPGHLRALLDRVWSLDQSTDVVVAAADSPDPAESPGDEDDSAVTEAPTVRLLDSILADAVRGRASDVHIEPQEQSVRVRYRVDGLMRNVVSLPKTVGRGLTARVKVVGGMDIAERRVPQDGRMRLTVDGTRVDARLSTMPSVHGETVVIRLLPGAASLQSLDTLGLDPVQAATLSRALQSSQGLVLITGPTGSGKTNTLYAAIQATVTPERNVVTLEDPVEVELPGLTQVPVNEKTGMTFARGLRAMLRQDPDVVLVGEVRDTVTAELALRAAMTGHLVLTTLHTNDAVAALPRLVDMGVEPYLVASSLTLVLAQRLVRIPCQECAEPYEPDPATLLALGMDPDEMATLRAAGATPTRGVGCEVCGRSGYLGRRGLFEVLEVTADLRRALLTGADETKVADLARLHGYVPLRDGGLALAQRGETTYEEVLRVTRATI